MLLLSRSEARTFPVLGKSAAFDTRRRLCPRLAVARIARRAVSKLVYRAPCRQTPTLRRRSSPPSLVAVMHHGRRRPLPSGNGNGISPIALFRRQESAALSSPRLTPVWPAVMGRTDFWTTIDR